MQEHDFPPAPPRVPERKHRPEIAPPQPEREVHPGQPKHPEVQPNQNPEIIPISPPEVA